MGKSKGTRIYIRYIPFALGPYLHPFTISVAIIVITNRKTSYRDNRENITINNKILKYGTGLIYCLLIDTYVCTFTVEYWTVVSDMLRYRMLEIAVFIIVR